MPILQQNDAAAVARYTEFVTRSPWGNLMQDRGWAHVKKGWVGEQVYLEQNGEITAAMSIIFAPAVAGRTLAYAPRGPVCDPYDTETIAALMREAAPALKKHRAFLLRFDPETPYTDELIAKYEKLGLRCRARNCGLHDQIQPRFNMFLPLEGNTLEELMPAFGEKTRYNIRLSARKGVTTRWAGAEELETFFRIYLETCERDGIGHRPLDYFQRMLEAYGPERCRVCLAEYEGEPLAAAIALHYGRKVFYIYGASSNEKRNLMPAYAMQAEMIRWACSLGVDFYDFGGVYSLSKENGLYRFKEGFCHSVGVTELAGEFDQVLSPFWYWAFLRGKPLLQKLRHGAAARRAVPALCTHRRSLYAANCSASAGSAHHSGKPYPHPGDHAQSPQPRGDFLLRPPAEPLLAGHRGPVRRGGPQDQRGPRRAAALPRSGPVGCAGQLYHHRRRGQHHPGSHPQ